MLVVYWDIYELNLQFTRPVILNSVSGFSSPITVGQFPCRF